MLKLSLAAVALAAATVAAPALAQDSDLPAGTATAPDGTRAFGLDPYVAVMGGWEGFDRRPGHGIPAVGPNGNKLDGGLVQGVVGFNVPLGPVFIGAEGNAAKGSRATSTGNMARRAASASARARAACSTARSATSGSTSTASARTALISTRSPTASAPRSAPRTSACRA